MVIGVERRGERRVERRWRGGERKRDERRGGWEKRSEEGDEMNFKESHSQAKLAESVRAVLWNRGRSLMCL